MDKLTITIEKLNDNHYKITDNKLINFKLSGDVDSYADCISYYHEHLNFLTKEYVNVIDDDLTNDALEFKRKLIDEYNLFPDYL